ncbi:MAG: EamA family transporter [Hamadaea sp.]|nr:EamA family transporter [Hamadaea sp.]
MKSGVFFVAAAAVAWGMGGVVASVLYRISGMGPLAVSFWRAGFGVLVLVLVQLARRRPVGLRALFPRDWVMIVIGLGLAVYQSAYYLSIAEAGVAVGTVATLGACPILVAVGARLFLGEPLTGRALLAIGVAIAGLVMIVGGPGEVGPHPVLGVIWALASAAGYAVVTLLTRRYADRIGSDDVGKTLASFVVATLCLSPMAAAEGLLPASNGLVALGWLIFLGIVPTAMAYTMFFNGLKTVPATTAAMLVLIEPVSALAVAVAVLGERLGLPAVAGTVMLLAAVAAMSVPVRRGSREAVAVGTAGLDRAAPEPVGAGAPEASGDPAPAR